MECKHRPELTLKEYMRNAFSKNKKRMNNFNYPIEKGKIK